MNTIRKPKVGDKVLYFPASTDIDALHNYLGVNDPLSATVVRIFPNNPYALANLCVLADGGISQNSPASTPETPRWITVMTLWRTSIYHKKEEALSHLEETEDGRNAPYWIFEDELDELGPKFNPEV